MWRGGDASGADELVSGTYPMSDVNSPTKEVYSAALDANTTEFSAGTNYMTPGVAAAGDIDDGNMVIIFVFELVTSSTNKGYFSKRAAGSPDYGYEVYTPNFFSGYVQSQLDTPGGVRQHSLTGHGTGAYVYMLKRENSGDADAEAVATALGNTAGILSTTTLTNSASLQIGATRTYGTSNHFRFGMMAIFTGADADGWTLADRTTIAEKLGIE